MIIRMFGFLPEEPPADFAASSPCNKVVMSILRVQYEKSFRKAGPVSKPRRTQFSGMRHTAALKMLQILLRHQKARDFTIVPTRSVKSSPVKGSPGANG
jgi:hypothetical protein